MDDKTFFSYYIPALKKALDEEKNNPEYLKDPSWFYPKEMYDILDKYEDAIYDKYSILDRVYGYFDAKNHGFSKIGETDINEYIEKIIKYIPILEKLLGIGKDNSDYG